MTLDFSIGALEKQPSRYVLGSKPLPAQLDVWTMRTLDTDFEFSIDGVCVLRQGAWNIGELAMQLAAWHRAGLPANFHYNCVDAEETNLFTLKQHGPDFLFYSECGINSSQHLVEREALGQFISQFAAAVSQRIRQDLGLDASAYLGG